MLFNVPPTSPNILPISSLPLARPHFGKYTCASSANSDRMLSPEDVTPPLSNAFRYSSATDLRCSSVIVCLVRAMASPYWNNETEPPQGHWLAATITRGEPAYSSSTSAARCRSTAPWFRDPLSVISCP